MKPVLLRTDAELEMGGSWPASVHDAFKVVTAENDRPETLIRLAAEADLIFTCYAPITAEVIQASQRLRGIVKYGVGVDSIDLAAAARQGIPVAHCPDYGTDTVADHAFALLISVARRITSIDTSLRQAGGWLWPQPEYCGVDLAGKTLGLIGFGRIGKAMARRGGGFQMRRLVYDPYVPADTDGWGDLRFGSLESVIEQADFLSLHCVLTPETRHMVGAEQFRRLKNSAILVNVSRGALIDEAALIAALDAGQIAGAGLDVFPHEPLPSNYPLLNRDNVLITPHFAFYTKEAYDRLEAQCLSAVRQLWAGEWPPHVKNADLLRQAAGDAATSHAPARSNQPPANVAPDRWQTVEGDVNLSPQRLEWRAKNIDAATAELLDRDADAFLHQSLSTPCLNVLTHSAGSLLTDHQGRQILDFHGNSVHQIGYGHPRVIEAIKRQLDTLPFCPRRFTNEPAIELAERLAQIAPGELNKVLLAPAGTAAVGMALKLARYVTGRHKTISMWDTFHGASLDAISVGGEALFRDGLGPLLPGAFHVPWPRETADANAVEQILATEGDVGAIVAEPMRCTTVEHPPVAYWQRIRDLCDEYNALLVFDEIPLALGRTGRMFCCEHFGVVPDILVIGKGLGGGVMPLAAMITRDDLDVVADRAIGHYTHEKNPVAAAAALATLDVLASEALVARAAELGAAAYERLARLERDQELVSDVRGLGLALAVELTRDGQPATDAAQQILYACLEAGLSYKVSSGNVLTLMPPLNIPIEQLDAALEIVERAVAEVSNLAQV